MLLRLYKGAVPRSLFMVIVILLAVWVTAFKIPVADTAVSFEGNPMPLYAILKMLPGINPIYGIVFNLLLFLLIAFILVNFNTSIVFIGERTFLPALFYALVTGLFPQCRDFNPVLPASLFLIMAVIRIIDSYHKPGVAYNFFDAGLLIGTGSLFYANLIWLGIIIIVGIVIIRTANILEIVVSLLGLITPFFFLFGIYYVTGKDLTQLLSILIFNLFGNHQHYEFTLWHLVALAGASFILFISVAYLLLNISKKKIKSRATFSILIWMFFLLIGVYILVPSVSIELIWLIAIPASYFLSHYFLFARKKLVNEIFFTMIFLLVLLVQVLYAFGR
jgi:hypothetical protein